MENKKTTTIKELLKQRQKQITSEAGVEVQNTNNNSSNKFNLAVKRKKQLTSKAGLEVQSITIQTYYMNIRAKATEDLKKYKVFSL